MVDLTLVAGVDMSSAEAFVRVQRVLAAKYVTLVFCGFKVDSAVGKALKSVGIMGTEGVELFLTLNDAMECECPMNVCRILPHLCEKGQRMYTSRHIIGHKNWKWAFPSVGFILLRSFCS